MDGARWDPARFLHPNPRQAGRSYTDAAALVEGIYSFDPGFFGLSPREAVQMDPQQRLLLMTVFEALEDAGLTPERRQAGLVGTYVGCSASDHAHGFLGQPERIDASFMTGNTLSIVANRIAHAFDLGGPSFTVDTACSSSLVALDQAMRALDSGEIDWAVVGGVHALLSPYPFIGFSRAGMLSPTGRLRAFDADADGYVRGEGAVALILGRAEAAEAEGDRIRGILAATATNATGRAGGLTKPVSARQASLIRETLARARATPEAVAFVEAHGTGTPVGDPQEAEAIGSALGTGRCQPLPIGSAKPNIGHLEPASGLAGLLKAVLALRHGCLPPSIGCERPTPAIDWAALNLRVAAEPTVLPAAEDRCAIINSFGFGGANACAVLRPAPPMANPEPAEARALILSANSGSALKKGVSAWRRALAEKPFAAARANAAAHRRARLSHIAVALDPTGGTDALSADRLVTDRHPGGRHDVVFAFCGNGANHDAMGAALYGADDRFRAAYDHVAALFRARDPGLEPKIEPDTAPDPIRDQPRLFALQVALVEALAARGLRAGATIGHSVGEIAAAWAAGGLGLEDAVQLIATRAPLLGPQRGTGGMMAVLCGADALDEALAEADIGGLSISGENSPRSCTLSGPDEALEAFQAFARRKRIAARRLPVEYPFHSGALDPLRQAFHTAIDGLTPQRSDIPFAASTEGRIIGTETMNIGFWWRNLREPVRFRPAVECLAEQGFSLFLEIGPKPLLKSYIADTLSGLGRPVAVHPSLDSRNPEISASEIVARMVACGGTTDMTAFVGPRARSVPDLPRYGWDLSHHKLTESQTASHPVLGTRAPGSAHWESLADPALLPWLGDHRVAGTAVMPAAAFLCAMLEAAQELDQDNRLEIAEFRIETALSLGDDDARRLRTRHERSGDHMVIESSAPAAEAWTVHAEARLRMAAALPDLPPPLQKDSGQVTGDADLYAALTADGLSYGPSFRRVTRVIEGDGGPDGARVARVSLAAPAAGTPAHEAAITALDAAVQALQPLIRSALPSETLAGDLLLPSRVGMLRRLGPIETTSDADLHLTDAKPGGVTANMVLRGPDGVPVLVVQGLRLTRISRPRRPQPVLLREALVPLDPVADAPSLSAAGKDARAHRQTDADLLIDALCRDAVLEVQRRCEDEINCVAGDPSAPAHGLAQMLCQLVADDQTDPPDKASLIDALLAVAPETAPRLRQALSLETALMQALREGMPQTLPGLVDADPVQTALCEALTDTATAIAKAWPAKGRFNVFALDEPAAKIARRLAPSRHLSDLTVISEGADAPATGAVDMVIGSSGKPVPAWIADRLSPNGTILAVERAPSLLARLATALADPDHPHEFDSTGLAICPAPLRISETRETPGGTVLLAGLAGGVPATADAAPTDAAQTELVATIERACPSSGLAGPLPLAAPEELALLIAADSAKTADHLAQTAAAMRDLLAAGARALWVLCTGAERPDETPLASGLSGLVRTIANEHATVACRLLTLPPKPWSQATRCRLAQLLAHPPKDRELHLCQGGLHATRLLRATELTPASVLEGQARSVLRLTRRGDGGLLTAEAAARRAPEVGEIEIAVAATGLNFRDVMWANGLLPDEALEGGYIGATLGMEMAGTVVRAGPGTRFRHGDRVAAVGPEGFASHTTLRAEAAVALPDGISLPVAASLPVAFLTALYALETVAQINEGESVLIHGGAGGVGLAALQIAKARGARVIATAGAPDKRALVKAMGAEAVLDSRSLDFAQQIHVLTGGRGVDVVLNSLSGDAMLRSLRCLAPFGRFIELGKRDILADGRIGLRALRDNISYHAVDADGLLAARPALAARLLQRIEADLNSGRISPLPVQVFGSNKAKAAMDGMRSAEHVGKIVVRAPAAPATVAPARFGEGAWLIAGGLGGFGLATAEWLAAQGVRRIWLTGRSGQPACGAEGTLQALRARGLDLRTEAVDIGDQAAMVDLFARLAEHGPIEGVVHAAMVLADAPLAECDNALVARVLHPKIVGAEALDHASRAHGVRQFLLYGSVAAAIGNPMQAAYAAANAALAGIARRRRAGGLPANMIGWGPIGDVGYLSRDHRLRQRMAGALGELMEVQDALDVLHRVLADPSTPAVLYAATLPWQRLAAALPGLSAPLFSAMVDARRDRTDAPDGTMDIANMDETAAVAHLRGVLCAVIAEVLRQPKAEVDPHRPLLDLGLDSLMAVDLRLALEDRLGVTLPAIALDGEMTTSDFARRLLPAIRAPQPGSQDGAERDLDRLMRAHLSGDAGAMPTDLTQQILGATDRSIRR